MHRPAQKTVVVVYNMEYFCDFCLEESECEDHLKCIHDRAVVTCAYPCCSSMVRYPVGTPRPRYCNKHMQEMLKRKVHPELFKE